mmetsp:Transcript_9778/g.26694  ORF Transcript_9778/g.26694 Transcript_9778/m.26694 type:complete len:260 (-) Transcript_9778:1194-1973(-)
MRSQGRSAEYVWPPLNSDPCQRSRSGNSGSAGQLPMVIFCLVVLLFVFSIGFMGFMPLALLACLRRAPSTEDAKRRSVREVIASRMVIIRALSSRDLPRPSILVERMSAWAWITRRSLLCAVPLSFLQPLMNSVMVRVREPSPSITANSLAAPISGRPRALMRHCTSGFFTASRNSWRSTSPLPSRSDSTNTSLMLSSSCFLVLSSRALAFLSFLAAACSMCSTMMLITMFRRPYVDNTRKMMKKMPISHCMLITCRAT